MAYSKPALARVDLKVEHCMCSSNCDTTVGDVLVICTPGGGQMFVE